MGPSDWDDYCASLNDDIERDRESERAWIRAWDMGFDSPRDMEAYFASLCNDPESRRP